MIIKLIQTSTRDFISALWMMSYQAQTLGEQFHKVRQLYEIHEIENKVPDGTESFPGDGQSLTSGVTIEFQCVVSCVAPRFLDDRPETQKCFLLLPWLRNLCAPRRIVQDRKGSTLRQSGLINLRRFDP